jgi:beta-lactam-binding protein with PASTA domain
MKSSIPRNQVPKNRQELAEAATNTSQVVNIQEPTVLQTIAKKEEVPTYLYITAWVNNQPLK